MGMLRSICPIQLQHCDIANWVHLLELTLWKELWFELLMSMWWIYMFDRIHLELQCILLTTMSFHCHLPLSLTLSPSFLDTYICLAIWFPGPVSGFNTLISIMHPITSGMYHHPIVSSAVGKLSIVQIDHPIGILLLYLGTLVLSMQSFLYISKLP